MSSLHTSCDPTGGTIHQAILSSEQELMEYVMAFEYYATLINTKRLHSDKA